MRVKKVMFNGLIGLISQIILISLGFITRKIFIMTLGPEMLGLNGLFVNILAMLDLAELGIGIAIMYNLYKPLIDKDEEKIAALMRLYKRIYYRIGSFILFIGLGIMFFLQYFIKDSIEELNFVRIIYMLQLLRTTFTYFLGYKRTLINADQRQYVCTSYDTVVRIIAAIFEISILLILKNYMLYLLVGIAQTCIGNLLIGRACDKRYPYLKELGKDYKKYKKGIYKDVKDIAVSKLGGYIYGATDNMIISSFLGLSQVGFLANYTLIVYTLKGFLESSMSPIQASIGHYVNEVECIEDTINIFNIYTLIRFLIVSFCITCLIVLIQPFIILWLGKEWLLSSSIIVLMCMTFYIEIVHSPLMYYISGVGLFRYEKGINFIAAIINLSISIFLIQFIGVQGVLLGTVISGLFYWISRTFIVFRFYFYKSPAEYGIRMCKYFIIMLFEIVVTYILSLVFLDKTDIISLLARLIICIIIPNGINYIIFNKTKEFSYLKNILRQVIRIKLNTK